MSIAKTQRFKTSKSKVVKKSGRALLTKEDKLTKLIASKASKQAVRISKALELPVQFIVNGKLIKVHTDGEKQVVKAIPKSKSKVKVFKGATLCLNPKD
ncbi:hypothetical protein [Sphingobacterium sp. MYb382]|uniref:hypothetical protein n=1 Tax=Sphingobacterium sp. MYb382 TaxID=2745278 RepID=UPI0030AA3E26